MYDGSGDPEDHLMIFQAAAKVERWEMPTWCHMFNSTLTESARVWFDDLPSESVDSYDDLKKEFLANYLQQKKCIKDLVEIPHIKQREGKSTKDFVQRFKAKMNKDDVVVLMDDKEEDKKEEEANVDENDQVQGRQAKSQAEIYKIDMDHASKVLSMQEDEPAKVQEVVDVVTTAKLITEVITVASKIVTAASTTISTAEPQVPTATITAATITAVVPSRRRKGVVIRDPEEESTTSLIIPADTKSKDKGKRIMVEEPKPRKKKQQIEMDEEYARKLHAELNKDIEWDVAIDHVKLKAKEDLDNRWKRKRAKSRALQSINETPAQKAAKRRKLNEEVEDLKRHLEIVPDEDDDVYTEATPLARKNFDREDLEALWNLVKERFSTSKPKNFSDDFLLTTLGVMFEKPDIHAQVWKNQRSIHGQAKVKSWKLLESCGHFARECRSPKDSRRPGASDPQRKTVPVETSTSNALVSQCDGTGSYDWSYQAAEEPANFTLMGLSPSALLLIMRDTALVTLRQKLEKAEQERDDLKLKLDKFQSTFKNLTELLASQTNEKHGLGYFSSESDYESCSPSSLSDRSQPNGGYHVVPPPITRTFMPPKPDLVFHTAHITVETDHYAFTIQLSTSKPAQDLSHRNRPSVPIIEEWVSDSEDESKTKAPQIVPSFV
nr:reverse transcriptase domain-containing protein [Tanacetum cinerariifolium]